MHKTTSREDRYRDGRKVLDAIDGTAGAAVIDSLDGVAPELAHQVVAWGFGEIYSALADLLPSGN